MCEVKKGEKCIQFIGTHCEAGGSEAMKVSQFYELRDLADKYAVDSIPLFYLGDFNCDEDNPSLYPKLLEALKATNGNLSGELKCTTDQRECDMREIKPNGKRKVIDFILERDNNAKPLQVERQVRRYRQQWNKRQKDLSDHYAVYAVCSW